MSCGGGLSGYINRVANDGISTTAILAHSNLGIGPITDIPSIELCFCCGMDGYVAGILTIFPTGIDGGIIDFNTRSAHHISDSGDFDISTILGARRRINIGVFDRNHAIKRLILRIGLELRIMRRSGELNLAAIRSDVYLFGRTFSFHMQIVFSDDVNPSSVGN